MKRITLSLVFLFVSTLCFSQWSVELSSGLSLYNRQKNSSYEINNGYSFGLGLSKYMLKNFGWGTYLNMIYLPEAVGVDNDGSQILKEKDTNFLFAFDFSIGLFFAVYNTEKIRVPIFIGYRMYAFGIRTEMDLSDIFPEYKNNNFYSGKLYYSYDETNMGIGIHIGIEFHFNRKIYFLAKIQSGFDFYSHYNQEITGEKNFWFGGSPTQINETEEKYEFINAWSVTHQIGIGIKL